MENISNQELKKVYLLFSSPKYEEIIKKGDTDISSNEDVVLVRKIAQNCSWEEFEAFAQNGEIPSLELSPTEMEKLKGGGWLTSALRWVARKIKPFLDELDDAICVGVAVN